MDRNVSDQDTTSHNRDPARRRIPTAVWVALITTGVPSLTALVLNLAGPTVGAESWSPFWKVVILLCIVAFLVLVITVAVMFVTDWIRRRRHPG